MALLYTGVNNNTINMIGHWNSNEMIQYLNIQAETTARNFLYLMIDHVTYYFIPHHEAPCF